MKKIISSLLFLIAATTMSAQNLQLHYDFGSNVYPDEEKGRQNVTATFEHFSADKMGSWYYFIDLDFTKQGVMGAYTEISREMKLGTSPISAHVEYDGGLTVGEDNKFGSIYQQAALVGLAYNGHTTDFSTTYSLQLLYKQFFKGADKHRAYSSAQLTGVWSTTLAENLLTFSGFIDLWRGEKANNHGQLVVLSEPQFWVNVSDHFSLGTEVEISNNFIYNTANENTFFCNPTVAVKYKF